jgi:hypothetical protein
MQHRAEHLRSSKHCNNIHIKWNNLLNQYDELLNDVTQLIESN